MPQPNASDQTALVDPALSTALAEHSAHIAYTPEEKDALLSVLTEAENATATVTSLDTARSRRRPRVLLAAASTALLVSGSAAVALNGTTPVHNLATELFPSLAAPTDIVNKIGRPVGASATANGVTITADAILGDAHSLVVVYSIEKEDGTPFENLPATPDGKLMVGFDHWNTRLPGMGGQGGMAYFYDADPNDPAIQLVEQTTSSHAGPIVGKAVHAHFENFRVADGGSSTDTANNQEIASGTWDLSFRLNYEDLSVPVPLTSVPVEGVPSPGTLADAPQPTRLKELTVSPIAVYVTYAADNADGPAPQVGAISVELADGAQLELEQGATGCDTATGTTTCEAVAFLPQITDTADIAAVSVGGTRFATN